MKIHKLPTFATCLEEGDVVVVYVIPSKSLKLPPGLLYPALLEYGLNMPNPIDNLHWTEEGIYATLSFNQTPHETFVPWDSVVGIGPKEGDFMVTWQQPENDTVETYPKIVPTRPTLKVVK